MRSQNASLKRSVVQTAALKLEAEFGSSDRECLQKLIDLMAKITPWRIILPCKLGS